MFSSSSKIIQFLVQAIIPVACTILLGLLLCGGVILNRYLTVSQFIDTPIIASVFYSLLVLRNPRDAYAGLFVMLILVIVFTHAEAPVYILRSILYVAAIGAAVYLYVRYFKENARSNYFYAAVTLAGLYAATYILALVVNLALLKAFAPLLVPLWRPEDAARIGGFFGSTIGFSVGAGITLAGRLISKPHGVQREEV